MSLGDSNDDFAMGDDDYDLAASGEAADGLGDEDFFGEEEAPVVREPDYQILSRAHIVKEQQKDIDKIQEFLGVQPNQGRILLMHFGWDAERLLTVFFEKGKEQVYREAGVKDPDAKKETPTGKFTCNGCYDDYPLKESYAAACGHRFCNSCWGTYITMKIKEGQSRRINCMGHKCNIIFDETLISDYVDKKTYDMYIQNLSDSFVEDNPRIKWCPSVPHCGHAVRAREGASLTTDVKCICNWVFCFGCAGEAHSPASCDMMKRWIKKCQDDSETVNYIVANTKECPKCGKQIERDGGCNLMTCKCGQYFCWLCGAPTGFAHTWTNIEGHTCGKWKPDASKNADDAKEQLKRYAHYWERFKASDDMKKHKTTLKQQLHEKEMKLLERISGFETKWLLKGFAQLLECRRILAHSYVFAYYMFGKEMPFSSRIDPVKNSLHKNLFEDYQQEVEKVVEKLHKFLLTPAPDILTNPKILTDIMNTAVLVDRRCKGLFDIIISDILGVADYGFQISHYTPQIEGTGSGNPGRAMLKMSRERSDPKPSAPAPASAKNKPSAADAKPAPAVVKAADADAAKKKEQKKDEKKDKTKADKKEKKEKEKKPKKK